MVRVSIDTPKELIDVIFGIGTKSEPFVNTFDDMKRFRKKHCNPFDDEIALLEDCTCAVQHFL